MYSLLVERWRAAGLEGRRERAGRLERPDDGRRPGHGRGRRLLVGGAVPEQGLERRAHVVPDVEGLHGGRGGAERGRLVDGDGMLIVGRGAADLEHGLAGRELGLAVVLVGYGKFVPSDARSPAELFDGGVLSDVVRAVGHRRRFRGERLGRRRALVTAVEYVRQRF